MPFLNGNMRFQIRIAEGFIVGEPNAFHGMLFAAMDGVQHGHMLVILFL